MKIFYWNRFLSVDYKKNKSSTKIFHKRTEGSLNNPSIRCRFINELDTNITILEHITSISDFLPAYKLTYMPLIPYSTKILCIWNTQSYTFQVSENVKFFALMNLTVHNHTDYIRSIVDDLPRNITRCSVELYNRNERHTQLLHFNCIDVSELVDIYRYLERCVF